MHTFETICRIDSTKYWYLYSNLPSLTKVGNYTARTNYYSAKGITQIELKTFEYPDSGIIRHEYYLVLRCNPNILVGGSKTLLVDLEQYSANEILKHLQKRLYEINQFRFLQLDKLPIAIFKARTVHLAVDILTDYPQLLVWLCNMAFPYHYRKMERAKISKPAETLYTESCYFRNKSRRVNIYCKLAELLNNSREIDSEEFETVSHIVRFEIQLEKQGIYNLKLPTKRELEPFLDKDFCHSYIEKEVKSIFGTERFVSRRKAVELINNSTFKPYEKAVMVSIMDMIYRFKGLYELEKAIANEVAPQQYGNLRTFKERWLKKFKQLGVQPVTIPDIYGIDEMPSVYQLIERSINYDS